MHQTNCFELSYSMLISYCHEDVGANLFEMGTSKKQLTLQSSNDVFAVT